MNKPTITKPKPAISRPKKPAVVARPKRRPTRDAPGKLRLEVRRLIARGEVPKSFTALGKKHKVSRQRASAVWSQELARRGLTTKTERVLQQDVG